MKVAEFVKTTQRKRIENSRLDIGAGVVDSLIRYLANLTAATVQVDWRQAHVG